jgi:hypothetical protein
MVKCILIGRLFWLQELRNYKPGHLINRKFPDTIDATSMGNVFTALNLKNLLWKKSSE